MEASPSKPSTPKQGEAPSTPKMKEVTRRLKVGKQILSKEENLTMSSLETIEMPPLRINTGVGGLGSPGGFDGGFGGPGSYGVGSTGAHGGPGGFNSPRGPGGLGGPRGFGGPGGSGSFGIGGSGVNEGISGPRGGLYQDGDVLGDMRGGASPREKLAALYASPDMYDDLVANVKYLGLENIFSDVNERASERRLTTLHWAAHRGDCRLIHQLLTLAVLDPIDTKSFLKVRKYRDLVAVQRKYKLRRARKLRRQRKERMDATGNVDEGDVENTDIDIEGDSSDDDGDSSDTDEEAERKEAEAIAREAADDPITVFIHVNEIDNNGWTPLHHACYEGHIDAARMLILNGANVNAKTNEGYTPLHYSVVYNEEEMVRLLAFYKADCNAMNKRKWTPLHYACDRQYKGVATELVNHGANPFMEDESKKRCVDYAAAELSVKVQRQYAKLLKGAPPKAPLKNSRRTSLQSSLSGDDEEVDECVRRIEMREKWENQRIAKLEETLGKGGKRLNQLLNERQSTLRNLDLLHEEVEAFSKK